MPDQNLVQRSGQIQEPTAEEIARVDAWRKANAATIREQEARQRDEKKAAYFEAVRARLEGRTIKSIDGSKVDPYNEWTGLTLVFEDGGAVVIDGGWNDGTIDIDFRDQHDG